MSAVARRAHDLAHEQARPRPSDLTVSAAAMVRREIVRTGAGNADTVVVAALTGYLPQAADDHEFAEITRAVFAAKTETVQQLTRGSDT